MQLTPHPVSIGSTSGLIDYSAKPTLFSLERMGQRPPLRKEWTMYQRTKSDVAPPKLDQVS